MYLEIVSHASGTHLERECDQQILPEHLPLEVIVWIVTSSSIRTAAL